MPRKTPELPDVQIRRLRHGTTKSGKPWKRQLYNYRLRIIPIMITISGISAIMSIALDEHEIADIAETIETEVTQ